MTQKEVIRSPPLCHEWREGDQIGHSNHSVRQDQFSGICGQHWPHCHVIHKNLRKEKDDVLTLL